MTTSRTAPRRCLARKKVRLFRFPQPPNLPPRMATVLGAVLSNPAGRHPLSSGSCARMCSHVSHVSRSDARRSTPLLNSLHHRPRLATSHVCAADSGCFTSHYTMYELTTSLHISTCHAVTCGWPSLARMALLSAWRAAHRAKPRNGPTCHTWVRHVSR